MHTPPALAAAALATTLTVGVSSPAQATVVDDVVATVMAQVNGLFSQIKLPSFAGLSSQAGSSTATGYRATRPDLEAVRGTVMTEFNAYRVSHGRAPVAFHVRQANDAQGWADHLNAQGGTRIWHSGTNTFENIALTAGPDAHAAVQQWQASPSHNAVMLDPGLHVGGVGVAQNALGQYIVVLRGYF